MPESKQVATVRIASVESLLKQPTSVLNADVDDRHFTRHFNKSALNKYSVGGFVEKSAIADPNTFISADSLVLEKAAVCDFASIKHGTVLKGDARISDKTVLDGKKSPIVMATGYICTSKTFTSQEEVDKYLEWRKSVLRQGWS